MLCVDQLPRRQSVSRSLAGQGTHSMRARESYCCSAGRLGGRSYRAFPVHLSLEFAFSSRTPAHGMQFLTSALRRMHLVGLQHEPAVTLLRLFGSEPARTLSCCPLPPAAELLQPTPRRTALLVRRSSAKLSAQQQLRKGPSQWRSTSTENSGSPQQRSFQRAGKNSPPWQRNSRQRQSNGRVPMPLASSDNDPDEEEGSDAVFQQPAMQSPEEARFAPVMSLRHVKC